MAITSFQVRTIFDTLPVGYYLGRNINVELSESSNDSYYNPMADKIVISEPCILKTCNQNALPEDQVEEVVRGLVYHEISHVILTGKNWIDSCRSNKSKTLFNIVEDERIETILKDFYMNVNFRRNIFRICQYHGQDPKDSMDAFFQFIRFHKADKKWLKRLEKLLAQYKSNNAATTYWNDYIADIEKLYKDFTKEYEQNGGQSGNDDQDQDGDSQNGDGQSQGNSGDSNNQNSSSGSSNSGDNGNNSSGNGGSQMTSEDIQKILDDIANGAKDNATQQEKDAAETAAKELAKAIDKMADATQEFDMTGVGPGKENSVLKRATKDVFDRYTNITLTANLRKVLEVAKKKKGYFSGAYNSYSGRINPRDCSRDDCKWWIKDNRNSSQKRFSKIHFNLFIDHSGSFCSCSDAINELLKALNSIKSPDFDFDVITIDTRIVEWETTDQYEFYANGGTDLRNDIAPVIRRHQRAGCLNYNIVVFDGAAHDYCYNKTNEPFNHFDTANTILVVDESNRKFVDHLTSCKKTIIQGNYEKVFIKEVLDLLERVIA